MVVVGGRSLVPSWVGLSSVLWDEISRAQPNLILKPPSNHPQITLNPPPPRPSSASSSPLPTSSLPVIGRAHCHHRDHQSPAAPSLVATGRRILTLVSDRRCLNLYTPLLDRQAISHIFHHDPATIESHSHLALSSRPTQPICISRRDPY